MQFLNHFLYPINHCRANPTSPVSLAPVLAAFSIVEKHPVLHYEIQPRAGVLLRSRFAGGFQAVVPPGAHLLKDTVEEKLDFFGETEIHTRRYHVDREV
jgi:hypothetical protein